MRLNALRPRPLALPVMLALAASLVHAAPAPQEPTLDYTVESRDTLIGLGQGLLVSPGAWTEVAKLNALPNPNRIQPGQVLKVPTRLLRSAQVPAKLVSVEGDVRIDDQAAKVGDNVQPGQRLSTAASSSAVLQLGDGSRVRLSPASDTQLGENRRYQLKAGQAGSVEEGLFASTMRLVKGSVDVLATKVLRAKPLEVVTPTAVIGVRGTEYRVHTEAVANASTRTEVLEGRVRADNTSAGADVPAGQGAALRPGSAPVVVALQAAPNLTSLPERFERPLVRFGLAGETLPLRVQVAADAGFERIVRDERVAAGGEARIAGLQDGQWHLRVRRVDNLGIEGLNATRAITLKARPEPPASLAPRAQAKFPVGPVALAWAENTEASQYRVEVARDAAFSQVAWRSDDVTGAGTSVPLTEAGTYHWRLASVRAGGDRGPWGDAQNFELRPLPTPPQGGVRRDGGIELSWSGRAEDRQQVELALDPGFTEVTAKAELTKSFWSLPSPDRPGTYYFRYRSVEPDGFVSPWSSTLKLEVPRDWRFLWIFSPVILLAL